MAFTNAEKRLAVAYMQYHQNMAGNAATYMAHTIRDLEKGHGIKVSNNAIKNWSRNPELQPTESEWNIVKGTEEVIDIKEKELHEIYDMVQREALSVIFAQIKSGVYAEKSPIEQAKILDSLANGSKAAKPQQKTQQMPAIYNDNRQLHVAPGQSVPELQAPTGADILAQSRAKDKKRSEIIESKIFQQ